MPRSHPKVFVEADNESRDGGTPRLLRGPLAGPRPCDASGGPRPRPPGTTTGLVFPLPGRFAGLGPRRGERIRRADDAAGARLGGYERGLWAGMAMVPGLRSVSADRPTVSRARGGLGLLPVPPLGQRNCQRPLGDPSPDSNGLDPRPHAPRLCARPLVPLNLRPPKLL